MIKYKLVDVSAIEPPSIPQSRSDADIEHFANLYLASGVMTSPLILKEFKPERFRVIHGYDEYYIALRAKQKDLDQAEMVNAFVLDLKATPQEESAILEQVRETIAPSDPSEHKETGEVALNSEQFSQVLKVLHQLDTRITKYETAFDRFQDELTAKNAELLEKIEQTNRQTIDRLETQEVQPIPEDWLKRLEEKIAGIQLPSAESHEIGRNIEQSLSQLIHNLATGKLNAKIELTTPSEVPSEPRFLPTGKLNAKMELTTSSEIPSELRFLEFLNTSEESELREFLEKGRTNKNVMNNVIHQRSDGKFMSIQDLDKRVAGLGPKIIQKLLDLFEVDSGK